MTTVVKDRYVWRRLRELLWQKSKQRKPTLALVAGGFVLSEMRPMIYWERRWDDEPFYPEQSTSIASMNTAIGFGAAQQQRVKRTNDGVDLDHLGVGYEEIDCLKGFERQMTQGLGEGEVPDYSDYKGDLGTTTTLTLPSIEMKEKEGGLCVEHKICVPVHLSWWYVLTVTIQTRRRGRSNNSPTPQPNLPRILRNAAMVPGL
ncbi:hypothetical protein K435DRAFT_842227 [Dendrothele bispora CBS 962.96]|uniref:Uncharacterized protein n=1 Tax=Dendrothele bispora (strain CBS 962.96) TaxID=1314807 RepID=A0A4S8LH01_DENBC|nr:hypothetical protein K435DRAFT_842227 [Dendrothele bispora CBS 962.96]